MNDSHPSGRQATIPSSTPPIHNGQKPIALSSQSSDPAQAQDFVDAQAVQPQMQQSQMVKPQTLDSMQFQPQVVSSDTDDIVLGGYEQKKSKKRLVVGIVIATLVLLGVGVGAMLLSRKNTAIELLKSKDTFNIYANYLLFGNATNVAIDANLDDVRETVYALDCEDKTHPECKEFFEEAKILLDNFRSSDYKGSLSEEYILEVENYLLLFDEYYSYIVFNVIDDDAILARYMEDGYNGVIRYIEEYYGELVNSDDVFLVNYGKYEIERAEITIDALKELDEAGCIADEQYNQDCVSTFDYSEDIKDRTLSFVDGVSNTVLGSINSIRNSLVYETICLSDFLLKNGDGNEKN